MRTEEEITGAPLAAGARDVARLAARHAAAADRERRLRPDVVRAVVDAGFARHFVPRRWGGTAGTFTELADAVTAVGEGCAATAWVASLGSTVARMAAHLPEKGQAELWAEGPDTLLVGALMPVGRAEAVPGGWRLSGTWSFISAVDHSQWALVCATAPSGGQPRARYFAVERTAYTIRDTWFSVGMRGTGSNTLVLDGTFVPEHLSFDREQVMEGTGSPSPAACHRVPLKAVNGLSFVLPVLGAARGMLTAWTAWAAARAGAGAAHDAGFRDALARTAGELDAAELLVRRAAAVADQGTHTGLLTARGARDCALASETLLTSVNRMFRATGTSGQAAGGPFERSWRDVNSATSHLVLRLDAAATAYAEQVLADG
ncbi:hydrolase [Streptomyces eurocidicus]|uniref:Hydrolase n=1 Tax=Streptomyces eurocidicus TaxID=66423 RepID=A0A2N8NZ65_STREU|nr:acyl-CoA dehydrogenase family protein [Streptomyces eurocidicus]MBB5122706.1 two-component flavin-dependent monooxygenase/oxygenase LndZ5 [Streptomyces eurocidicus]PNE34066.1 hydrolase [Streptomyces eurocidicus]